MRVLIVKTSSMGDVLHTLPAVTDAAQCIPDIRFDWVVEEDFAQIPGWHDAVENVIPVALRRWRKAWFSAPVRRERHIFRKRLNKTYYDAIIDAQGLIKSAALVTRLARGKKHGMDWKSAREPLATLFYTCRHRIIRQQHAVERIRELFAKSLNYKKPDTQGDYAIAQHFISPTPLQQPYVVFLHSTTRDNKHWPESHWRALIKEIKGQGVRVKLPWGAPHEHVRATRMAEGFDYVDVMPRMSLDEVARLLAGARYVVSVDTGLSHLAAALNKCNITLYGPTDPGLIGGYGRNQAVCCSENDNMAFLTSESVIRKIPASFL